MRTMIVGLVLMLGACDDGGDRRSRLLAGCKQDSDCPEGMTCEKMRCTHQENRSAGMCIAPNWFTDSARVHLCCGLSLCDSEFSH